MSEITQARLKIVEFLQSELGKSSDAMQFLRLCKSADGWEGTVQMTEPNEFLKKIGFPPVFDRNNYVVSLDAGFNVVRYGREEMEEG